MNSLPVGGNRKPQSLRYHDALHGLARRHADRHGGFALALADGGETGPEYFAHVGAIVESQRQDTRPKAREYDAQLRQGEEEEEDLQIERSPTNKGYVKSAYCVERRECRQAPQGGKQGQQRGQDDGKERDSDGGPDAAGNETPVLCNEPRIELDAFNAERQVLLAAEDQHEHRKQDDP